MCEETTDAAERGYVRRDDAVEESMQLEGDAWRRAMHPRDDTTEKSTKVDALFSESTVDLN